MKYYFLTLTIFALVAIGFQACNPTQEARDKALSVHFDSLLKTDKTIQQQLVQFYQDTATSPLHEEERANFKGITFYPLSKDYITEADFEPIANGKTIAMPTSSNKIKYFKEYGLAKFSINGEKCQLTLYQSDPPIKGYEQSLFLPFKDATSGFETYGMGRYMDIEMSEIINRKLILDFNRAYHPYCAYSEHYNCPITPANNTLTIKIEAGVNLKN